MEQQSSNPPRHNGPAYRNPSAARLIPSLIAALIVLFLGLICLTLA